MAELFVVLLCLVCVRTCASSQTESGCLRVNENRELTILPPAGFHGPSPFLLFFFFFFFSSCSRSLVLTWHDFVVLVKTQKSNLTFPIAYLALTCLFKYVLVFSYHQGGLYRLSMTHFSWLSKSNWAGHFTVCPPWPLGWHRQRIPSRTYSQ